MSEQTLDVTTLATRCAETRRVMMGAWATQDIGRSYALDLMGIDPRDLVREHVQFADIVCRTNADGLAASTLFLADEDMVDLLDVAAPTMPDQELAETDLIAPYGFLYFADPLPDRSDSPPQVPIHAIAWMYVEADAPIQGARGEGKGPAVLITSYVNTVEYARAKGMEDAQLAPGAARLIPNSSTMWTVGTLIGSVFGMVPEDPMFTPGFYQRVMAAFWTLTRQESMTQTEEQAPGKRPDRRRSARAGVLDPNAPVRVIRLRSAHRSDAQRSAGESGRKVGVRFPVRGFWRNQYLPSTKVHRQQWIAPHWRGPSDAPVVGGERVFLAHGQAPDTDQ
ncbi:hypothetical protein [Nocardioides pakistanensis]